MLITATLSLSIHSNFRLSAPTLSFVKSANPVPEEFRSSGTDFTASSGEPGSSHGTVLAATHFPIEATAHHNKHGGKTTLLYKIDEEQSSMFEDTAILTLVRYEYLNLT